LLREFRRIMPMAMRHKESLMKPIYLVILPALSIAALSMETSAQAWPRKPLRVIVPVAAGSSTDIVPRVVFEQLSQQIGQPIVVENRTGAGGTIGTSLVAKSEPDGYTMLAHGSAHTIAPSVYPKLGYHPARDFAGVIPLGISAQVMVVSPTKGLKSVGYLVAAAKARPGGFNFSSVGVGTATHLAAERFLASAGVNAVHVPFKGGVEAMSEAVAGRVEFFFGPVGLVLPHVREGRLLALVVNAPRRAAALPDVPTTLEAGFTDAEYPIWYGLFLPAKTPRNIVDMLHRETFKALQTPRTRDRLATLAVDPMAMAPKEFDTHVEKEIAVNAALIKATGIKLD
jgi:tripartite-type tricarboxylate transporter receptor subunit TctC